MKEGQVRVFSIALMHKTLKNHRNQVSRYIQSPHQEARI